MTEEKKSDEKTTEDEKEKAPSALKAGESGKDENADDAEEECAADDAAEDEDREKLKAAELLMEKGDHAKAGRLLNELLQKENLSRDVRDEIEFLMERLKPDPVALWIGVACLVLIAILALTTLGR